MRFVTRVPGAKRIDAGCDPSGRGVESVTLCNANGVIVRLLSFGAAVQSIVVPDRNGAMADVVLGFPDLDGYLGSRDYMGVSVGRVANRLAGGRFVTDGREYQVPQNDGVNALHGGPAGLDRRVWDIQEVRDGPSPGVTFQCISPDGDQGFPGELTVTANYALTPADVVELTYEATTDRATPVNITSHVYWNMAGEGAAEGALGNLLTLCADAYLPNDGGAIPTGEFRSVDGTAFDFRRAAPVGSRVRDWREEQLRIARGYDHNWVVGPEPVHDPRVVAVLEDPVSGRALELSSDQPGVQMYSGNFLDGRVVGKSGRSYRQGDAVVLEPQMFPDTPNRPEFGSLRLDPGQSYRNRIRYRFFTR